MDDRAGRARHRPSGIRAGAELSEHDSHHADSSARRCRSSRCATAFPTTCERSSRCRPSCRRPARVKELVDALEVRALANHDENLRFALLGDLPDADAETTPSDQEVIDLAAELIAGLNARYGPRPLLPVEPPPHMEPVRGAVDGMGAKTRQAARIQSRAARRPRHDVRHRWSATAISCRPCATSSRSTRTPICRWTRDEGSSARLRIR